MDIVRQCFNTIFQIHEKGSDANLEASFAQQLAQLQANAQNIEPVYLNSLLAQLKCILGFVQALPALKPPANAQLWFTENLKLLSEKIIEATTDLTKFNALITESLTIQEKIQSQQLSLFISPYTDKALKDLSDDPANLADFYSTLGLLRSYLPQLKESSRFLLQGILDRLCFIRISTKMTQDLFIQISNTLRRSASLAQALYNPLTSAEVAKDITQDALQILKSAQHLSASYEQAEECEVERFAKLFAKYTSATLFSHLFTGHSASLLTFSVIKKYREPTSTDYILLAATIHAINTVRDYWHKAAQDDQELFFQDLKAMSDNLLLFFQNRQKAEKSFNKSMQHLANQAVTDFKQHYKDLIALAHTFTSK